jgi:thaumarchaeosortase
MKFNLVKIYCTGIILNRHKQSVIVIIILLWPVLLSYVLFPDTFEFSWNEGRGGFLIVAILTIIEIIGSHPIIACRKISLLITFAILIGSYFFILSLGTSYLLLDIGRSVGALITESWMLMWDYIFLAVYFAIILVLIFGTKEWLRIGGAATLFLVGYATILLLDSLFPYDTLGILQYLVPTYLHFNVEILDSIIHFLNLEKEVTSQTFGNTLVLYSPDGPFVMKVYWPSAGVHSIVIFGLVMFAFLLKTVIQWKRILIYLFSGIILTCIVNCIRIAFLSFYAINPNSELGSWEQFHSVIGEMVFIPWVLFYLAVIIYLENRYYETNRDLNLHDNSCSSKGR